MKLFLKASFIKLPVFIAILLLTGCQPAPPSAIAPLDFSHMPALTLRAERLEIAQSYAPSAHYPYVEHLFPTPPYEAIREWAEQTLRTEGSEGLLVLDIIDASVQEIPLELKQGVEGWLTTEPSERYDASLIVTLKLYLPNELLPVAEANVSVRQSRSVREDSTLEEREQFFQQLVQNLVSNMDQELRRQTGQYFSAYIIP